MDGGGHYGKTGQGKDKARSAQLRLYGIEIKRYSDSEVLREPQNVLKDLELFIAALNPHPRPLLFKERGYDGYEEEPFVFKAGFRRK